MAIVNAAPYSDVHADAITGLRYHQYFLSSPRDKLVRQAFQRLALGFLPAGAPILDFGAGTGIDAKVYAAAGHPTHVHEPATSMRSHLLEYCQEEIAHGTVFVTDLPPPSRVKAILANFAVLNHIADQSALFANFAAMLDPDGFVLVSLLNPYCLRDARYRWWWKSLPKLLRDGRYGLAEAASLHRFTPAVMAHAARPHFRLAMTVPSALGLAFRQFMFLLFRPV